MELLLKLNENQKEAQTLLDFLKSLSFVKLEEIDVPNKETIESINEVESGLTKKVNRKSNSIIDDILNS